MKKLIKAVTLGATLAIFGAVATLPTGCTGGGSDKSTGEYIDDASITSKVKAKMLGDPDVKGLAVKVKTYKRTVQLSGFVDTESQKMRAGEIAKAVEGVEWVRNDIIVK